MCRNAHLVAALIYLSPLCAMAVEPPAMGPLKVHPDNPRYFADANGRAIWLTGSHTWANRQERGVAGKTPDFDYQRYLDDLTQNGHNFIRLWAWEHAQWMQFVAKEVPVRYAPLPYQRSGPGKALDGKPRFDLTKFNGEYFTRLRQRVEAARQRNIYVGVMFFQGFSLNKTRGNKEKGNAWHGHPFHAANNINGIDGNPSGDDSGNEVHTLNIPKITKLQESYVRKTIDTLNDLDNVLWEIGNECHRNSVPWQYHMIRFIQRYEFQRPQQHMVGMTGAPIGAADLLNSSADWISPPGESWLTEPPANDAKKIVLVDNDHCAPWDHDPMWAWKNFFRGNHFILMDGYMDFRVHSPKHPDPQWDVTRRSMGVVRRFAESLDLAKFTPRPHGSSTGYCLADSDNNYLVYHPHPKGGFFTLNINAGNYSAQWLDPNTGKIIASETVKTKNGEHRFETPQRAAAVLRLTRKP